MRTTRVGVLVAGLLFVAATGAASAATLLIDDFNRGEKPNALGGDYGAWNKDESDPTQKCTNSFDKPNAYGGAGYALKLDYDVDSPNPAYNGFWMKLQGTNASAYKSLVLYVKGDAGRGYSPQIKLELKNGSEVGKFLLKGITDDWQQVSIPLKEFAGLGDLSNLTEFVVVFDDLTSIKKVGTIYLDEISLEN
ncbi:MAG: carbohydrate binding domain-containing protein [Candidatus Omnitrophota bacterium]|nr:carbohydrate binding domain-containing protein [Candidatus Omnitrophota bacterium]